MIQRDLSVPTMLFWRFGIAALVMVVYVGCKHQQVFSAAVKLRAYILPFLLGGICYGGSSALYFFASPYIGTGLAMVIFFSYPIFVLVLLLISGQERVNGFIVAALAAIVLGLYLLKGNDEHPVHIVGILLAVSAALLYAAYVFKSKNIISNLTPAVITLMVCLGCAVMFFIWALLTHSFVIPTDVKTWAYILGLAVFVTALPILLLLEGLKSISSIKASILSVFEPLVTVLVGVTLLGESISYLQMFGVVIILLGTIISQFAREM